MPRTLLHDASHDSGVSCSSSLFWGCFGVISVFISNAFLSLGAQVDAFFESGQRTKEDGQRIKEDGQRIKGKREFWVSPDDAF